MAQDTQDIATFLKRLCQYGIAFGIILILVHLINDVLINQNVFKADLTTNTLICGPSILRSAVDPSILDHSQNISQNEELYPMTYYKLKSILPHNPQITRVVIAFSPGMISKKLENLAFQNPIFEKEIINRLYPITEPTDYENWPINQKTVRQVFFQRKMLPDTRYIGHLWQSLFSDNPKATLPYIGQFKSKKKSKIKESQERLIRRLTPQNDDERKLSPFLEQGLHDIIQLCREHNIDVVLLGPPIHNSIKQIVPQKVDERFSQLKSVLLGDRVRILDLTDDVIPDEYYFNASHINATGAEYVTNRLDQFLTKEIK